VVQENLQRSRPHQQVKHEQEAGNVVGVVSHERVYGGVGLALALLARFGAQGEGLAEYHGLHGAFDVNGAARHAVSGAMLMCNVYCTKCLKNAAVEQGEGQGGAQVAANENALQQLHEEQHEDVEDGLAQLEAFLVRVQLLQDGPQEISGAGGA